MKYSVIIPTYIAKKEDISKLKKCLSGLAQSEFREQTEIIVVDDASPRQTEIKEISQLYDARYLRLSCNQGPGVARNEGAKISKGEILAFTDHDCIPPKQWLSVMTEPLKKKEVGATTATYVGPVLRTWLTHFQDLDFQYRTPAHRCITNFVHSCSFVIERSLFFREGGFPKDRVFEDQLLGRRLALQGSPPLYIPEGGVLHHYHTRLGGLLKQRFSFAAAIAHFYLSTFKISDILKSLNRTFFCGERKPHIKTKNYVSLITSIFIHHRFFYFMLKKIGYVQAFSYYPLIILLDFIYIFGIGHVLMRRLFFRSIMKPVPVLERSSDICD